MDDATPTLADTFFRERFPFHELLGIETGSLGTGEVSLRLAVTEKHLRPRGIAHGGVLATLVDIGLGMAAATTAPPGTDVVTMQLNMNFLKPVRAGDELTATGFVVHRGRRTIVARVEILTSEGIPVATGSGTLMILDPRPA